jgi:GNAT superfamily N-acetyltransferase
VGFAIGAQKSKSFYSNILKSNFLRLAFSASIPLLLNPLLIYRLYISLKTSPKIDHNIVDNAILLSICVDPLKSTKGYGTILLSKFEEIAFEYSNAISLTTDAIKNDYVNTFYERNGYNLMSSFFQENRKMNYYMKSKNNMIIRV